jgi:aminoglycoside phosphotransferase
VDSEAQEDYKEAIRRRLPQLMDFASPSTFPGSTLGRLTEGLPALFDEDYPKVLTHGDFSVTNILIDRDALDITGIVDWSLAAVRPFGMDLDILYMTTGFMTRDHGWHDYTCKEKLLDAFWEEFWSASGIEGKDRRARVKDLAEAAGQIGAILRQAFRRNKDGSLSEEVSLGGSRLAQLSAWLGEDS